MITLDLHAKPLDEALEAVVSFLDRAALRGAPEVCIMHGQGTGKLKKAVRAYLTTSSYVSHFRAGGAWEGGDGVTIVTLASSLTR